MKHEITAQFARAEMTTKYFNSARRTVGPVTTKAEVHHITDDKFHKGLRLESIFNPDETKKLKEEALEKALTSKKKLKPIFDPKL